MDRSYQAPETNLTHEHHLAKHNIRIALLSIFDIQIIANKAFSVLRTQILNPFSKNHVLLHYTSQTLQDLAHLIISALNLKYPINPF